MGVESGIGLGREIEGGREEGMEGERLVSRRSCSSCCSGRFVVVPAHPRRIRIENGVARRLKQGLVLLRQCRV